jgi:homogentisate 1,2-dioxygenase
MIYQIDFDTEENRLFTWNLLPFIPQKRYKTNQDNILHSPFCERDFILPNELETHEKGRFLIKIKKEGMMHEWWFTHPLT